VQEETTGVVAEQSLMQKSRNNAQPVCIGIGAAALQSLIL
jgi:hypothetical protein